MSSSRVFRACRALMAAAKSGTKASARTSAKPAATVTASKPKISRTGGILKSVPVSPALGKFLGVHEVSRTDAVKKIWDYVKSNNLQSGTDKRIIYCDEKLKTIFDGKDKVGFLEITRLLSQHFVKTR